MAKNYEQDNIGGVNIIAAGTTFVGDIITVGDCRIDGNVKGNIKSKYKIIVGQSGILEGNIHCQSIEIEGYAKANVHAEESITLKATAKLAGDIAVGKISIEPGASFMGNCKMHNDSADTSSEPPIGAE